MTITEFLAARFDEDEGQARSDIDHFGGTLDPSDKWIVDGARRVLADVAAKRAIVEIHADVNDGNCATCVDGQWGYPVLGGSTPSLWPCPTLKALALPYAEHEDYDEGWRP